MSAVHNLAKSEIRPTADQIITAIADDLQFVEREFRSEQHKLSMADAMAALIEVLARRTFNAQDWDMVEATLALASAGRRGITGFDDYRYDNALDHFRAAADEFAAHHATQIEREMDGMK